MNLVEGLDNSLFTDASQTALFETWDDIPETISMINKYGSCSQQKDCVCRIRNHPNHHDVDPGVDTGSKSISKVFWCCDKSCAGWCEDNDGNILERSSYINSKGDESTGDESTGDESTGDESTGDESIAETLCKASGYNWHPPKIDTYESEYKDAPPGSGNTCDTNKTYVGPSKHYNEYPYFEHASLCDFESRLKIINHDIDICKGRTTACKFMNKEKPYVDYINLRRSANDKIVELSPKIDDDDK